MRKGKKGVEKKYDMTYHGCDDFDPRWSNRVWEIIFWNCTDLVDNLGCDNKKETLSKFR